MAAAANPRVTGAAPAPLLLPPRLLRCAAGGNRGRRGTLLAAALRGVRSGTGPPTGPQRGAALLAGVPWATAARRRRRPATSLAGEGALPAPALALTPSARRPLLPLRHRFLCCTNAAASSGGEPSPSTNGGNNLLAPLVELWQRTVQPLGDYGFGKRSVWEGGVGLFMVSGAVLLALALAWLRGFQLRSRFRKYNAVFEFSQACGICVGTPLRIRGVTVGNVVRVDSSLKSIDAYVEVEDDKIIVPRNSLVEVNQSGLLMETMIDITPKDPLPTPSVGPLDADCSKEGLILCDKERMKGHQGVSLDALVGIFTRLGRDMEEIGVQKSFKLAEKVASIMEEAQPLLSRIEALAEEVQPLLSEVRESDLVKDVETIAKGLAEASGDLRRLKSSMLTPENSDLIKQSIFTLIFTLKNIESISSDISGFTGDEATRQNIKLLIKSLSRLL
ncbi:hypothetical protein CFC21_064164 [Triticum aestivum]|uniref:Mce/MlaD domain-containing protein n=3 Tax=Triticum TaxID=4564 RepID=A0A9R0WJF9_TRITD|nr:protein TRIGALACTOSYLDIACYLGLYCEROL 2, chloroplastic-like isoform X1 [Triticum dicoccoides]XP_044379422.1 protein TRIGALACTOSYLDIACYLGLYCEROL 2, chloroplastic-like [Triticum aestivum]KAF7056785.1 hypothetical protein CFC21_064164 [Triticum aestivum]VAI12884.1 unnamed protein product [Triticum turgidum subsp. durum]